ncbi:MAG: YeeE/YedE family protein [Anaerolineaceae bacterium]|nr:YeeE/YedE family protein [Anaerolineaceae bacterium]
MNSIIGPLLGVLCGIIFGVVLQRGRVCFNSAFRDLYLTKDNFMFKAGLFAVALSAIGFTAMAQFGLIKLAPSVLNWGGVIVGGLLFGMGMVLAGGCASGMTYRIGEGNTVSIVAGLVYGLSAWATGSGVLKPLTNWAANLNVVAANADPAFYNVANGGKIGPTFATLLNLNPWIPVLVFAVLIFVYLFATKTTRREGANMKWWVIGIALTLVNMLTYFLSAQYAKRQYGLGITAGWTNMLQAFTLSQSGAEKPPMFNFAGGIVLGVIIGAFIAAVVTKEFKWRVPKQGKYYAWAVLGGLMAGFGASFAKGCNIGHFLTGSSFVSVGDILATVMFILGNWLMVRILFGKPEPNIEA